MMPALGGGKGITWRGTISISKLGNSMSSATGSMRWTSTCSISPFQQERREEVNSLEDDELLEIIDRAKPMEYQQALLAANYDPGRLLNKETSWDLWTLIVSAVHSGRLWLSRSRLRCRILASGYPALVVWKMDSKAMNLHCVNERTRRMTTDLERDLWRGRSLLYLYSTTRVVRSIHDQRSFGRSFYY